MATVTSSTSSAQRISFARLLWVGPLAIIAATIANVLLQQIAVAVLRPDPAFLPLSLMAPIIFTVVGVLGAVIVFAVAARFAHKPIQLFRRIALVTLFVSLIPDILMYITGFNPGTAIANVVVLMLMHVVAWSISVWMLTNLTLE
jgi:hypothetical protein